MRTLLKLSALVLGVMAVAAPEPKVEMTVQLPPFIVDRPAGPQWRYLQIPRFEILSRCNDLATEQLATAFHRANQLLGAVLPEKFQLQLDGSQAVIFYDRNLWPAAEQAAVGAMLRDRASARPAGLAAAPRVRIEPIGGAELIGGARSTTDRDEFFFSNLMLADADTITTFALVSESALDPDSYYLTPAYVSNLLESRAPALPPWFVAGFMQLYRGMQFRGPTVSVRLVRGDAEEVLPLETVLDGRALADNPSRWQEQCERLVAWGIDPDAGRRAGFWKFVERASNEPVTEMVFWECLGIDYCGAEEQLRGLAATGRTLRWTQPESAVRLPERPLEDASSRQVARIKGEWERLEARYVRANQPELETQYVELARKTLRKAYDRDDRDPRLLASLGLLELEAGDKAAAVTYLEAAVRDGVGRPRAYYELARLRYDRLVGRSTRNDGKYPAEQIESVVQPLLAGLKQLPPLSAAYELLAHVTALSVEPPSPEVLAALAQGARLFPAKRDRLLELAAKRD